MKKLSIILGICYNYNGGNKMKKNNLWKAIGVCFIVFILLSWVIPTGSFSSGTLTTGSTSPFGIFDILRYPIVTASTSLFVLTGIVILLIGGFYGVLNKTGVYGKVVEDLTTKLKGKGTTFIVLTILIFAILSSLTALTLPLFILVPFFVTVILSLGYNKFTAFLSTVGAILVGNMASTYGFNINGYISYFLGTGINDTIVVRILFLLAMVGLLIGFVVLTDKLPEVKGKKTTKGAKKEETKLEIPLYEHHVEKKKSAVPMMIIIIALVLVALVGMYNWETGLHVTLFTDIHTAITDFEINGYALFANLLGSIDPIGYWSNYELAILLFLATLLIAWVYNVKGKEKWDAFVKGAKEMVPVALYTIAASILFLLMNSSNTGATFFNTIADFFFQLTKGFNVFTFGLTSVIGGVLYNDFPYMLNALYDPITTLYTNYGFIGMLMQALHGLVMFIAPTSVILVAGLKFLNISYTEWLKKAWKYLLLAFLVIVVFLLIMLLVA